MHLQGRAVVPPSPSPPPPLPPPPPHPYPTDQFTSVNPIDLIMLDL